MFDHQAFLYDNYVKYKLDDPGTHHCRIHMDIQPLIDQRLFSAEQYFEFIVSHCKIGYCQFYQTYFGQGNILNKRVQFARDWIACNRSKYGFLFVKSSEKFTKYFKQFCSGWLCCTGWFEKSIVTIAMVH